MNNDESKDRRKSSRRRFLQGAGAGTAGLILSEALRGATPPDSTTEANAANAALTPPEPAPAAATMMGVPFDRYERVRVGIVGVGLRGSSLLRDLLAIDGVEIKALCDIVPEKVARGQKQVTDAGQPEPAGYSNSERDFELLSSRGDIDLAYIATPWDWHVPMAIAAMRNGKHAAVEVPAATTLDHCWDLVNTSERTRRHCIMLENVCYGYNEMMVLNMVRDGLFGELTHGEAAYIHDLRGILTEDANEGLWRRFPHMRRNGNLYPTHGLGPVAQYLGIHHGDRFEVQVSMSSLEHSLTEYVRENYPADNPKRQEKYVCGDMNTSLVRTARGRTVMLQHDVVSPRPYDRINLISGTKGIFQDYPPRIYLDGKSEGHRWQSIDPFKEQYEHPLWKRVGELARKLGGHGGMDFIMSYRLIECMREGLPPDMDVYDAAAWSAPGPLSEQSVRRGSAPVKFPDFTRGQWQRRA